MQSESEPHGEDVWERTRCHHLGLPPLSPFGIPAIDQNPRDSRLSSVGIVGSVWKWLGVMERSVRPESGNLFTSTFRLGIAQQDNLGGDLDKAMGWIQGTFGNPSAEQFDKVRRNYVDAMETMLNHAQSEEASSTHNRSREKDKGAGESRQ